METCYFKLLFFRVDKVLRLLVASSHGYLYVYNLDIEDGGECTLWRTHRFLITCYILFFIIIKYITFVKCRLDGQIDVVDSPKSIKPKEVNSSKLDKNIKTESPVNKHLGR